MTITASLTLEKILTNGAAMLRYEMFICCFQVPLVRATHWNAVVV